MRGSEWKLKNEWLEACICEAIYCEASNCVNGFEHRGTMTAKTGRAAIRVIAGSRRGGVKAVKRNARWICQRGEATWKERSPHDDGDH